MENVTLSDFLMKHKPKNKSPAILRRKQKHMGEIFSEVLKL